MKTRARQSAARDDPRAPRMSTPSLPRELVYAVARAAWVEDDARERRERGVEREFDATAKPDALELMATLVEAFVEEATHRACALATLEGARAVDGEHLERVLPQLMLDFAG